MNHPLLSPKSEARIRTRKLEYLPVIILRFSTQPSNIWIMAEEMNDKHKICG